MLGTNTWKMKLKETTLSCPAMIGVGIGGLRVPGASGRGGGAGVHKRG